MADFERAKRYALQRLSNELPHNLYYHSLKHTRDDVVPAAERLAEMAGLGNHEALLLMTAAWFHDVGFTEQRDAHETLSIGVAREVLPEFGYSDDDVAHISEIILATRLPQTPQDFLGELMADADLDSIGRDDFLETSHALLDELRAYGSELSRLDWYRGQKKFLTTHEYFTEVAHELRDDGKARNIALLNDLIAELETDGDQ